MPKPLALNLSCYKVAQMADVGSGQILPAKTQNCEKRNGLWSVERERLSNAICPQMAEPNADLRVISGLYKGYIGIMEKKMATAIQGLGHS